MVGIHSKVTLQEPMQSFAKFVICVILQLIEKLSFAPEQGV